MEMCCLGIFPPSQSTQRSLVFVPLSLREKARSQFCLVTCGLVKPTGLCLTQVDSRSLQVNSRSLQVNGGSLQRSAFLCSPCAPSVSREECEEFTSALTLDFPVCPPPGGEKVLCVQLGGALRGANGAGGQPPDRERGHHLCPQQAEDLVAV